jgi:DNA helicase-2/ATP-dependent DNA helicase PcrA
MMAEEDQTSPAEKASQECLMQVLKAIDEHQNFLVEAGAGAGKTYTLIKALKHLISKYSVEFERANKKIACITYTNVAKDEIKSRTDNHPVIIADTIHAFAWQVMQVFQKPLRDRISALGEKWVARIEEAGGITDQKVIYNLGYPKITDTEIFLHHDDVIKLFTSLLSDVKFRKIFANKYPVLLIDEYQDTNLSLANTLVENFIETEEGPLIGFFGDHWQKIYGSSSCGLIQATDGKLLSIGKQANFRSDKSIVDVLNNMRPELPQHEHDPNSAGEISVYHTNNFTGERRTGAHWNGDLPEDVAHERLETLKELLLASGWNISPETTKILMLTNNVLASEQGYQTVSSAFSDSDDYLKKNNEYISFLTDTVEIGAAAFLEKRYGLMIEAFRINTNRIRRHSDKQVWHDAMMQLNDERTNGTIGSVIDLLKVTSKPRLPKKIDERENRIATVRLQPEAERSDEDKNFLTKYDGIRTIPYPEIGNLAKYIDDKTIYSTKHGVKGAQFENVIVVFGRGWNHYNWNQMLEHVNSGNVPAANRDAYERNRNLFYVACSRPQHRLSLLFTQELSANAILGLQRWFGERVQPI